MTNKHKGRLPHLLVKNTATPTAYSPPKKNFDSQSSFPARNRQTHAQHLLDQLETIQQQSTEETSGIYLTFEVIPSFALKFESLELQSSGIELCNVLEIEGKTLATVFVPDGKLTHFFKKITQYRDNDTKMGKPQNEPLVASISEIKLATLRELWTDSPKLFPNTDNAVWWEIWLRSSSEIDCLTFIREHAPQFGMRVSSDVIKFLDRTVTLVYATKSQLSSSIHLLNIIAEIRAAKDTARFYTNMDRKEQKDWIDDALSRLNVPPENSPYVCILDTGVNDAHPLLNPISNSLDMHSYNPAWGSDDRQGHGTNMAGLAVYGDLTTPLSHALPIDVTHRLESVKILPNNGSTDKQLYGAITGESIARVGIDQPHRQRIFCMAVTAHDDKDRGRPSSWSAMIDVSSSGYFDEQQRLVIVSAGNTEASNRHQYPDNNLTDEIHDPAQSWNALTVGAYTEKVWLDQQYSDAGWQVIAPYGDLSPSSCTSMTWDKTWPIKPEIVMEGGNQAISPHDGKAEYYDGLQLLTTGHQFQLGKPLVSFGDTSAATALASRLAAKVQATYPEYWVETVRALLIHSAEWTAAMKAQFPLDLF